MGYPKVKIYTDGSHYIGIPETHRQTKKRPKRACRGETMLQANSIESNDKTENEKSAKPMTVNEEFERLYKENSNSPKVERNQKIVQELTPRFKDEETAKAFVDNKIERMKRNRIERMKRLMRKVRLQQWNFFVTFTYNDKKHTEESFRKVWKKRFQGDSKKRYRLYHSVFNQIHRKVRRTNNLFSRIADLLCIGHYGRGYNLPLWYRR